MRLLHTAMNNKKNDAPKFGATPCICPRCGKSHKAKFWFTGRGTPRRFCTDCQWFVEVYDDQSERIQTHFDRNLRATTI
jgi:hypothetical protein